MVSWGQKPGHSVETKKQLEMEEQDHEASKVEGGYGRDMGGVLLREKYQEVQTAAWTRTGPSASDIPD